MNEGRGGLLTTGGIFAIIAGVIGLITGILLVVWGQRWIVVPTSPAFLVLPGLTEFSMAFAGIPVIGEITGQWPLVGTVLAALSVAATMGGISAVKRGSFGLSLTGAICALPSGLLGVLAIVFVSVGRPKA